MSYFKFLLGIYWVRLGLLLAADGALLAGVGLLWVVVTLPRIPDNPNALLEEAGVSIYADSGELLYTFNQRVQQVGLAQVSPYFVQAVLATEDADFYDHHGFSLKAIAGAFLDNVRHMRKVRGGSTLTQQIVKNLFLTREKSYLRKVREVLLAAQLESMFRNRYGKRAKDRLLELYINGSFFGTNAYGVEDAARTYFGKRAKTLGLREAALLAGLPNAPSALSPFREDRAQTERRTDHVLRRMFAEGLIDRTALEAALKDTLVFVSERSPQNRTPYFVETIKTEVARRWGRSALSFGGLSIHTTLDLGLQQAAEDAVARGLADLDARMGFPDYRTASPAEREAYVQGALLCMDPQTGEVRAMVGGRDIFVSYYNRATTARRQPGSGFKPIAYLAAFSGGEITPVSLFMDAPRTYLVNNRPWAPRNFQERYLGLTTAAWALVNSANATTVQIVQRIGPERVVRTAERLGVESPLDAYPSIGLGASEVTLLDMVSAYGTIANYGIRVEPTFIRRIEDRDGAAVYRHRARPTPVVEAADAYVLIRLLQHVVDRGTGRAVRAAGLRGPAAGKTGTTNENTDAWFTGFVPGLVASVWVGFDSREGDRKLVEARTRRQITGGSGAAPIWGAFMKAASAGRPAPEPWMPPGVYETTVDPRTGVVAADSTGAVEGMEPVDPIRIALPERVSANTQEEVDRFLADHQPDEVVPSEVP